MSTALKSLHDVPAPAKLNLFLHVTGRRPDGYHLLQSVFMLIDWQDTLDFELRPAGRLSREDHGATLPEDDLCLRAARALQQATGTPHGVHIRLTKRLPAQAGLGGGSSDAASCLLALNRLWGLGLSRPGGHRPAAGGRCAVFPARTQRLGGGRGRADHAHRPAPGPLRGGQTRPGPGDRPDLFRPPAKAGHATCYNLGLCCTSLRLRL
jgi:hypothetical protein